MNITDLKNKEVGEDVYVVGSGASMDFIPKSFFKDKIVVAVNRTCFSCNAKYVVVKEPDIIDEIYYDDRSVRMNIVASRGVWGCVNSSRQRYLDAVYYFDHFNNEGDVINLSPLTDNRSNFLVVSWSTITSAIHFAYYLGARNIILCGHDCGTIDNKHNMAGYHSNNNGFYGKIESQTVRLVDRIRLNGVPVMSINPFINFGLEGHEYKRKNITE